MRRLLLLAVALLVLGGLLVSGPRTAEAVPMLITLDGLRAAAPTVVIATFVGPVGPKGAPTAYDLLVERALAGTAKPGLLRVLRSKIGAAYLTPGARVVAFIDKSNQFGWAGTLSKGKTLEDGTVGLVGFTDINAYAVVPAVVTLKQLEDFLKTGTLIYDFEGALWFPSAKGPVPSAITLKVHHDYGSKTTTVTGMPPMKGFPATPKISITGVAGGAVGGDVAAAWVDTLDRPLILAGEITGKKPTGALETKFFVRAPGSLTEPEFRTYALDPKLSHPFHEMGLALADGTTWKMQLGREIGRVGELTSPGGVVTQLGAVSLAPSRTIDGGALEIVLAPRAPTVALLGAPNTSDAIVQELLQGAIACTATRKGSSKPIGCTLTLTKTRYATP